MINSKLITAAVIGALLAGCNAYTSGTPPISQAPVPLQSIGVLQAAVGTANIGQNSNAIGLNVVVTFRQANGNTAALVNSPQIVGPTGFKVPTTISVNGGAPTNPCGTGCVDAGTNTISSTPQNLNPNVANPVTTFGQANGIFSYGIAPDNSGVSGAVAFALNSQPFYSTNTTSTGSQRFVGGPPAYPFFKDGTFPSGFIGYTQGFTEFNATPVAGTYTVNDTVASGNAGTATFTASATLSNTTPLPAEAAPVFVKDGAGGGTATVTVPADARITETMLYVFNSSAGTFFTVGPQAGTGALVFVLPDFLGPCTGAAGTGCQNNAATQTRTINTGNAFRVYAASYDYPAFEAGPPGNTQQSPTIAGAGGQADITTSSVLTATY